MWHLKHNRRNKTMPTNTNHSKFVHRIDALTQGHTTSEPGFGTVKCVKAAKASKNGKRLFSVSGSKIADNRGGYTFGKLMAAFGLHR